MTIITPIVILTVLLLTGGVMFKALKRFFEFLRYSEDMAEFTAFWSIVFPLAFSMILLIGAGLSASGVR